MAQFPGQFMHHFLEDHGVNILAEHVEEKPVSHVRLLDDRVDHLSADEAESDVEEVGTHLRTQDDDQSVEDNKQAENRQQDEPG